MTQIPKPHQFDPVILREYDIRGVVGTSLSDADAWAIGASLGTLVRRKGGNKVAVGFDGRHSSPALSAALVKGLRKTGVDVDRLPLGPTPMTYFAAKDRLFDAAVMVTGSHNPSDYNGFKMMLGGQSVFGKAIQEIGRMAAEADWDIAETQGQETELDIRADYIARLLKDFKPGKALRVAWDAGNGAVGAVLHDLIAKLPGEHFTLFDTVDGDFPNHHPDPTVDKNLIDLQKLVADKNCDLGIAFDGDGDRIGVINETGEIIRCDTLLALYARDVLVKHKGATIVGDVKCSPVLFQAIEDMGGQPLMWKTGHSLIKTKMAEVKSPLAGELSGHIFFADHWYGFDDALYCAVRLLNIVGAADGPLSTLTAYMPQVASMPEIRLEVDEARKFAIVDGLTDQAMKQAATQENVNVVTIDGIRVEYDHGWWLLRASNTQNALSIRMEADTKENLTKIYDTVQMLVRSEGLDLKSPR